MKKLVLSQILVMAVCLGVFLFFFFVLSEGKDFQNIAKGTQTYYEKIAGYYIETGFAIIATFVILAGGFAVVDEKAGIGWIVALAPGCVAYGLFSAIIIGPMFFYEPHNLPVASCILAIIVPMLVIIGFTLYVVYAGARHRHDVSVKLMSIALSSQAVITAGIMLFVVFS